MGRLEKEEIQVHIIANGSTPSSASYPFLPLPTHSHQLPAYTAAFPDPADTEGFGGAVGMLLPIAHDPRRVPRALSAAI